MAQAIRNLAGDGCCVAPSTSLSQMLELIRRASLLLTGDTGPLHMASSVGTPCISLHGPTLASESGPYGKQSIGIQSPMSRDSEKLVRKGPNLAMQAIQVQTVVENCRELLSPATAIRIAS